MAISAEQLNIILTAKDKQFAKAMERNQRRISRFEQKTKRSLVGASKSFSNLGRAAARLGPLLAAAFSVATINRVVKSAAEIGKLANVAGVSTEELQRFSVGAKTVGFEMEKVADILKDVNDKVGDFLATGGGPMADFFENIAPQVGVTAEQFATLSGPQALQLYVRSLEQANLSQAEMTFYMEALANDATALLPLLRNNASEMRRFGDEAASAGRILDDDAIKGAQDLQIKLDELASTFNTQLSQAILDNEEELRTLVTFITDTVIPAFAGLINMLAMAGVAVGEAGRFAQILRGDPYEGEPTANTSGTPHVPQSGASPHSATGTFVVDPDTGEIVEMGVDSPELESLLSRDAMRGTRPMPRPDISTTTATAPSGGSATNRLQEITDEYADLIRQIDQSVVAQQDYANAQQTVNAALAAGIISQSDANAALQMASGLLKKAEFDAMGLTSAMDQVGQSMESAFMSMIDGTMDAKDAFRSMARDIISELYNVLVVQRLVGSFQQDGGGILGAAFGAIGQASGGAVKSGQPYTVGEHGRELFVPQSAGRILSVSQTKAAMGGGGGPVQVVYQFQGGVTEADLGRALPLLVERTKREVVDAVQRGGSVARVFR